MMPRRTLIPAPVTPPLLLPARARPADQTDMRHMQDMTRVTPTGSQLPTQPTNSTKAGVTGCLIDMVWVARP